MRAAADGVVEAIAPISPNASSMAANTSSTRWLLITGQAQPTTTGRSSSAGATRQPVGRLLAIAKAVPPVQ